jgi:hypothetical protein
VITNVGLKEYVFRGRWDSPSKNYLLLMENEEQLWHIAKGYLDRHGIAYVDALTALRGQLSNGVQPYQVTQDGHPNRHGHRAIAQAVALLVRQFEWAR